MLKAYLRSPVAPWSGLIAAPVAWLLHHQGVSDASYFDCGYGNPASAVGLGLVSLLLLAAAASLSWHGRRADDAVHTEPQARWFLSMISLLLCALLGLAIGLQVMAGVIIPGCLR